MQQQERQLQELVRAQLLDHEKELKEQENKYCQLLNDERMKDLQREAQLQNDIKLLKASFHIYKVKILTNEFSLQFIIFRVI